MKRFLLLLTVILCVCTAWASYPLVRNFSRSANGAGSQTWAITRDGMGRLFFGNNSGLLVFDSSNWQIYGVSNGSTVRSLLLDESRPGRTRMYIGASEELGYFESDSITGRLEYTGLTHRLPLSALPCREIWNILKTGDDILFQADHHLFRFDGNNFTVIPVRDRITAVTEIEGRVYVATSPGGIGILHDNAIVPLNGNEIIADSRICAVLPYYDRVMLVTENDGLYSYDGHMVMPMTTDIDPFLRSNQVFCATCRDNQYAFGTVSKGVVVKNFISGNTTYANKDTGLQNNTVLSAYIDSDGILWLGLDNGIGLAYINSPCYTLLGDNSDYGAGYASRLVGGRLYLGTNQGLFIHDTHDRPSPKPPVLSQMLKGQIWAIEEVDNDVFVCSDAGLCYGRGPGFTPVAGIHGCWDVRRLPGDKALALVSTYDAFHILERVGDRWIDRGAVDGYNDRGGHFVIDNEGYIWVSHWLKGVYRLTLDVAAQRFSSSVFYDSSNGFPSDRNISVEMLDGRLVFMSEKGFYRLGPDARSVRPDTMLNKLLNTPTAPRIHASPSGTLWCIADNNITVASARTIESDAIDSITYSPMADRFIAGFDHFDFISDDRLLVSNQNGFFDVDLRAPSSPPVNCSVFFKSFVSYGDSAVYREPGIMSEDTHVTIPYHLNSQRFEVIEPEYRAENAVRYSFYLQNYDSGWSDFTPSPSKEYTKLPEGDYTMHVRAYNTFTHRMDERALQFSILPPWYRSTAARIIYLFFGLLFLYMGYKAVRRISLRSSQKIAQRKQEELDTMRIRAREESLLKDYEIADLKGRQLEQDIHFKTRELSNITMNVVRKNEILQDISDRLDKLVQVSDPAEVGRHINRIRALIRENISHDDDWRTFMHNFDAAYGDFTKRLQQRHAGLTPTELRVCCYLIMGLNSKEMARVFNISHRSVEMTRYRLRKKLDLTRDVNLTDYLQGIFNSTEQ